MLLSIQPDFIAALAATLFPYFSPDSDECVTTPEEEFKVSCTSKFQGSLCLALKVLRNLQKLLLIEKPGMRETDVESPIKKFKIVTKL